MDFVEIFTSGRYYGDMKILKILTSNSTSSEFIVFLKNDNLMMIGGGWGGGGSQILPFLRKLLPGYVF